MVMRKSLARATVIGGLAVAAVAAVAPLASAGTSNTTLGCYSTWGSTGSNAHCSNPYALDDGDYTNHGSCYYSSDQWSSLWGQVDCTFSINWSEVLYQS